MMSRCPEYEYEYVAYVRLKSCTKISSVQIAKYFVSIE